MGGSGTNRRSGRNVCGGLIRGVRVSEKPTSKGKRKQTRVVVTRPEPKESDEDFAERFRRAVLGEDAPAPKPQRGR